MCLADVALIEPTMLSCRGLAGATTLWPAGLMVRLPLLAKISIDYSFVECYELLKKGLRGNQQAHRPTKPAVIQWRDAP